MEMYDREYPDAVGVEHNRPILVWNWDKGFIVHQITGFQNGRPHSFYPEFRQNVALADGTLAPGFAMCLN